MNLATDEVARNLNQAFDILRRPQNAFARDFLLATGDDNQGDLSMLSNPYALAHATTACISGRRTDNGQVSPLQIVCMFIPGMCVNGVMAGVAVSALGASPLHPSSDVSYAMGRYVREQDTAETLMASKLLSKSGAACTPDSVYFSYFRHDSTAARYHLTAITRPGAMLRDIVRDFMAADRRALVAHFALVEGVAQARRNGCLTCGAPVCNCVLALSQSRTVLDFPAFRKNFADDCGEFNSVGVVCIRHEPDDAGQDPSAVPADSGRQGVAVGFKRLMAPPEITTNCITSDTEIALRMQNLAIQDRIQLSSPARGVMPMNSPVLEQRPFVPELFYSLKLDGRLGPLGSVGSLTVFTGTSPRSDDRAATLAQFQMGLLGEPVTQAGRLSEDAVATLPFQSVSPAQDEASRSALPDGAIDLGVDFIGEIIDGVKDSSSELFTDDLSALPFPDLSTSADFSNGSEAALHKSGDSGPVLATSLDELIGPLPTAPVEALPALATPDPAFSDQNKARHEPDSDELSKEIRRRERNRAAATRSNAKRKQRMDTLKSDLAKSKDAVRQLLEKEAALRRRNMELKELATRRLLANR